MVYRCSRAGWWLVAGVAGAACLAVPACSPSFSDCQASRDCADAGDGGASQSAAAVARAAAPGEGGATSDQAGAPNGDGDAGTATAGQSSGGDASAGANDDAGAGGAIARAGAGGNSAALDTVAPTILSITPVNGATNLTPVTDKIVITFSEPMNKGAAEAAYVPGLAGPAPVFSWNTVGNELTIDPKLAFPTATDPTALAIPFKFSVTTDAEDLAGNALAAPVNWQLTLLREITQALPYSGGGNLREGVFGSFPEAGDNSDNTARRGFMTFDISALPDGIDTIESATIRSVIAGILGDPFGLFGDMVIQSVSYTNIDQNAFDAPPLHDLGSFITATGSNAAGDAVSKDVLVALEDDYENRAARGDVSQYKLLFPAAPNSNATSDAAYLSENPRVSTLVVKYLYP
jgi:Bacterial Ig-like domain